MKKYLLNGQEVILVSQVDKKFIVQPVYEVGDEGEERTGNEFVVGEVFDNPPVEKYFSEINKLQSQIEELYDEKRTLQEDIRVETQKQTDFFKKAKRLKALARIEDFIDGKITHYVEENYSGVSIIEFKDAVSESEDSCSRIKPLRLLSLFGKSNGDLEWRLSKYSDHSGYQSEIFPCCSREDALAVCRERLSAMFESTKDNPRDYYIQSADKLGIEVPSEYRLSSVARTKSGLIERKAKIQADLSDVEQSLAQIQ